VLRVLKAKYYPRGELVDTGAMGDASPRRAIEHGLDLKKGIIWRVGPGTKIQI
jgi:hypothetical protein